MLKALQKRMKRAALSEASMSSTPARTIGWLATTPTVRPLMRPRPITRFAAQSRWISRKSARSTVRRITWRMSYGSRGSSGTTASKPSSAATTSSCSSRTNGGSSVLLLGRKESRRRASAIAEASSSATKWTTPETREWLSTPPRYSAVTSSPVTSLITDGPVM